MFKLLYRANLYSLSIVAKISILLLWQLLIPGAPDWFGQYALALGLTSTFFVFAGMRARVYVFGGIDSFRDFLSLKYFMALFGILALASVTALYAGHALLGLVLLVAIAKFFEMFLDANTSFIQKVWGRDLAYRLLNQHSIFLVSVFGLGLVLDGLWLAITFEIGVLILTVQRQAQALSGRPEPKEMPTTEYGALAVLANGAMLTLAATLNSALITGFLYWSNQNLSEVSVFTIAKVLALQAFCARLITGTNIFFLAELNAQRGQIVRLAWRVALISLAALVVFWPVSTFLTVPFALYCLGAIFTLANTANITIRQQLILNGVVKPLIAVHTLELGFLVVVFYIADLTAITAFVVFTMVRVVRSFFFVRLLGNHDKPPQA